MISVVGADESGKSGVSLVREVQLGMQIAVATVAYIGVTFELSVVSRRAIV